MAPAPVFRNALPSGTRLLEYRIDQVLGAGGFGITYRAHDVHLEKDVAIKEYLPSELAMRAPDGSVHPLSTGKDSGYRWGLERFLQEARTLAKFSHAHIVRVLRYFEANATAYMVMDYEQGDPLKTVLQHAPQPSEEKVKALVAPLLDGLAAIHAAGFLHRDIKPDNIFVRADGRPVLIDFGAARQALGGETRSLTSVLTPGYAPLEQYSGEGKQGPWTDLYAMGGVLYRAVVDKNPPDAVSRVRGESLGTSVAAGLASARGKYSESLLRAIEWALMLDEKQRPQSVEQWKGALFGEMTLLAPAQKIVSEQIKPKPQRPAKKRRWPYVAGVVVLALLAADVWRKNRANRLEAERTQQQRLLEARQQQRKPAALAAQQARPPVDTPARQAVAAAPAARAEGPAAASAKGFREEALAEFKSADANRDGYLSSEEARSRFPLVAKNFQRIDADGDGRISPREFFLAKRAMLERKFGKQGQ